MLQVVLEPTLGEGGSMRAGSGAGARGPVQGAVSGRLLGWKPLKGKRFGTICKVA